MGRFFLVGWALVAAAIYAGGLEFAYRRQAADESLVVSAESLWRAYALHGFAAIRAWVLAAAGPWFWREVATPLLALPAWLLLGAPGGLVAWAFHPRAGAEHAAADADARIADRLAATARDDGYALEDDVPKASEVPTVADDLGPAWREAEPESAAFYRRLADEARAAGFRDDESLPSTEVRFEPDPDDFAPDGESARIYRRLVEDARAGRDLDGDPGGEPRDPQLPDRSNPREGRG